LSIDVDYAKAAAATEARIGPASPPGWLVWAALWVVYIVWGSTYLAIRVTVETLPPLLAGGARFILAGLVLYSVLLVRRGRARMRITRAELAGSAVVGTALLLGGNGLVMVAEQDVSSSLTALLISAVPLWVVLFRYAAGEKVAVGTLIGVLVGFVGVGILVMPGGSGGDLLGALVVVAASFLWATGSILSKKLVLPKDPFLSTAVQMLCGGVSLSVAGLIAGEGAFDLGGFSADSLLALAYLVVIGSLLAFTAYVWLLQNAPISKVATYAYVNPVIAIFLGWAILSERITAVVLMGAAIIVASVAFIVSKESQPEVEEDTAEPDEPALVGADAR
jgi:drug/metabolite transporter (DMT)-like permease